MSDENDTTSKFFSVVICIPFDSYWMKKEFRVAQIVSVYMAPPGEPGEKQGVQMTLLLLLLQASGVRCRRHIVDKFLYCMAICAGG